MRGVSTDRFSRVLQEVSEGFEEFWRKNAFQDPNLGRVISENSVSKVIFGETLY